ncbi:MAG TPA: hypothetical protein VI698_06370 [Nitrososphaerales archaeon]|nr:hypothetical protein [Nitrososphaerales archaeon]
MDPLRKVDDAKFAKLIPQSVYKKIVTRFKFVKEGVKRIEKASGIKYPEYYVEPNIILSTSPLEMTQFGVLFARTIPKVSEDNRIKIIVQLTAPLIAFGIKGTIHAILAHEFLHYLELMGKMVRMDIISDELSSTFFEGKYADLTRLFEPEAVFKEKALLRLITKKFPEGFQDIKLEDKALKLWLNKGLPSIRISMDANVIRIPISAVANTEVDRNLRKKIKELQVTQDRKKN